MSQKLLITSGDRNHLWYYQEVLYHVLQQQHSFHEAAMIMAHCHLVHPFACNMGEPNDSAAKRSSKMFEPPTCVQNLEGAIRTGKFYITA